MNEFNQIQSLWAKHWTYQTLNECFNAAVNVVIFPIEKYKASRVSLKRRPKTMTLKP